MESSRSELVRQFGTHLASTDLKPKYIPYYQQWVKQFLAYLSAVPRHLRHDAAKHAAGFTRLLNDAGKFKAWQVHQAAAAVDMFIASGLLQIPRELDANSVAAVIEGIQREMSFRHYSARTAQAYGNWAFRFFDFIKKSPAHVTSEDVKTWLTWLAMRQKVAASTQNQAFNAMLFVFRYVLKRSYAGMDDTPRAKRKKHLPEVLSSTEVRQLLGAIRPPYRLMAELAYGCGLRLSECLNLRVKDIEMSRGMVVVRCGKGGKDRTTVLPVSLLGKLNAHLDDVRNLFNRDTAMGNVQVPMPGTRGGGTDGTVTEFGWYWVFPAHNLHVDKNTGQVCR